MPESTLIPIHLTERTTVRQVHIECIRVSKGRLKVTSVSASLLYG